MTAWMRMAAIALAGSAGTTAAYAQVMALSPTTMIGYAGTTAAGQYAQRQLGTRVSSPPAARPSASPQQILARANYQPDPAVRQQVYSRAVALVQKISPPDAAKLRQALSSGAVRSEVAGFLSQNGMSANNVIDTTAVYLGFAWFASRGSDGTPNRAQLQGLRRQLAVAFASTPALVGANNALKSEIAEANMLQASLSSTLGNQAAANPQIADKVRAAAVKGVQTSYHIDLSRMNLTARGLN